MPNKRGQPTKYKKDFHPENFITLSKEGKTFAQIARIWEINRDTIQEWRKKHKEFSVAVERGREFAEAWYMDLGQAAMLGLSEIKGIPAKINVKMFCWLTKNMFNWSNKV